MCMNHFILFSLLFAILGKVRQVLNPLEGDELAASLNRTDDYSGSSQDPQ